MALYIWFSYADMQSSYLASAQILFVWMSSSHAHEKWTSSTNHV